jgi:hypothetical protein
MSNRQRGIIFLCCCLLLIPISAHAQSGAYATLDAPDLESFPRVEAYLEVHDAQGNFIHGLQVDQIAILEDGHSLPVGEIHELRPGVQVVVVLNPGSSFGIRNNQAISRYDYLKEALRNWAISRQGSTIDDWSLLITGGPSISHVSDPAQLVSTLDSEQIDPRSAVPSLDTLFRGVSIASDPSPLPGMARVILFITPPPEADTLQSLENISVQASEQDVAIFVWMVSSPGAFATQSVEKLRDLSNQTNAKFFAYTGEEELPNPEEYLEPLRSIYHLVYQSNITENGSHQLLARIQLADGPIETNVQNFDMEVQAPQPAFVSPPLEIQRKLVSGKDENEATPELSPKEANLQVVFDFPDGHMRPLLKSELYVDGSPASENLEPPFDQFTWKLDQFTSDGTHQLQVRATDILGLTGSSIEIPVRISVETQSQDPLAAIRGNLPLLGGLTAVLAGAVLTLLLILGGRLRPRALRAARNQRRRPDPVTQSVQIENEPPARRLPNWVNRLSWSQRSAAPQAFAFLTQISDTENPSTEPPIPITSEETTIGNDPKQATLILDHPSIEGVHAHLRRQQEDGAFRLADAGSIAGTWVNYAPISKEGIKLEHGDLIHIGGIGFRFTLRQPGQVRKPVVTSEVPTEEPSEETKS